MALVDLGGLTIGRFLEKRSRRSLLPRRRSAFDGIFSMNSIVDDSSSSCSWWEGVLSADSACCCDAASVAVMSRSSVDPRLLLSCSPKLISREPTCCPRLAMHADEGSNEHAEELERLFEPHRLRLLRYS